MTPPLPMRWWGTQIGCTQCEKATHLYNLLFSADGELCFVSYCDECNIYVKWTISATKLQHQAWVNDMSAFMNQATLIGETPQLPPPAFTDEDIAWMRAMHVKEDE